jgi:hypothetical protein
MGTSGDPLLEPFCEHLLTKFDIVSWLADRQFIGKADRQTMLTAICAASDKLLADPQLAVDYWTRKHPNIKRKSRSAWPGEIRPDLKIADFLDKFLRQNRNL